MGFILWGAVYVYKWCFIGVGWCLEVIGFLFFSFFFFFSFLFYYFYATGWQLELKVVCALGI